MTVARVLGLFGGLLSGVAIGANLPVPCVAGSCGSNATLGWVSSGNASWTLAGNTLTVDQQSARAILNWQSFDISTDGIVDFRQPDATSVALNRIFQRGPSEILGRLTANGQVYLINQNGILFGADAQVNVHSLTASTLDISDEVFNDIGLTNAINQGLPAFEAAGPMGAIRIETGATLASAEGGRILVFAPEIENRGSLATPDGQAILAASQDRVYLASSDDDNLRGLLVEVGTGGSVANLGSIVAERGNVSLVGLAVNQDGLVRATTSVSLGGSVRLLARDGAVLVPQGDGTTVAQATRTGTLTVGSGSRTEVVPDDLTETATDLQDQAPPTVEMMAGTVTLESGARVYAPSGDVRITATRNPADPGPTAANSPNDSRVTLEDGSIIDVSGLDSAVLTMASNELEVELRGSQLQDAPLQRNGVLRNQTVIVDVREGTPLANISGELANRTRTLEERLAVGGRVLIESEGDVRVSEGATIDFSGGQVLYEAGVMNTTRLVTGGRVVDIGEASPDVVYEGIFGAHDDTQAKWGAGGTLYGTGFGRWEPGYVEGKDAGSLTLSARRLELGGTLRGEATAGPHQRRLPTLDATGVARDWQERPLGGLLVLGNANATGSSDFGLGDLSFGSLAALGAVGVTRLSAYANGTLTIPAGAILALGPGGELRLVGGTVAVEGSIVAPGGRVDLEARDTAQTVAADSLLRLGSTAVVDVGGTWINDGDLATPGTPTAPISIDGGSVSLTSGGDLWLAEGSLIDARGGAQLTRDGTVRAGHGGDVTIALDAALPTPGALDFGAEILGHAFGAGGTLSIQGAGVHLGAASDPEADGKLVLAPAYFSEQGFAEYQLSSTHLGISVGVGTVVAPRLRSRVLTDGYALAPTGSDLEGFSQLVELPDHQREAVSLGLTSRRVAGVSVDDAVLQVGRDAVLATDAGGTLALSSDSRILIDGTLSTPGGSIRLDLVAAEGTTNAAFDPSQALWLQSAGRLLAPGAVVREPVDDLGRSAGRVLDAGSVAVTTDRGYFIAEAGSIIDVSATEATLDLPAATGFERARVYGRAGEVAVTVAEGALLNGDLFGHAAGAPGASGGVLRLTIDTANRGFAAPGQTPFPTAPRDVVLAASGLSVNAPAGAAVPAELNGLLWIEAPRVEDGGFESLELRSAVGILGQERSRIRLEGNVSLNLPGQVVLDAPVLLSGGGVAELSAAYVSLGSSSRTIDGEIAAAGGAGTLRVSGDHVDLVGTLALRGFGDAGPSTITSAGDIRLLGTVIERRDGGVLLNGRLSSAADLVLQADQVYATTVTDYSIDVERADGRLVLLGDGEAVAPLSAGARITLSADHVEQRGVLVAPFGQIAIEAGQSLLLAPGSVTSTSGEDLIVPFGFTQFGADAIYPLLLTGVYDSPPEKRITLAAPDVIVATGSVVDLAGGGDLLAREFLPGPGGSVDVLDPANANGGFAIVPVPGDGFGVFDPLLSANTGIRPGDTITITTGSPVPAGEYAILPPGYALLPGAYLVTPVAGPATASPQAALTLANGSTVISGRRSSAASDAVDSLWGSYVVENGDTVRQRSEYTESTLDKFLSTRAADLGIDLGRLSRDAGRLVIEAGESLRLQGDLQSATGSGGRGAEVDIVADRVVVVPNGGPATPGQVSLSAADLNRLGAESVLIGGVRRAASGGGTAIDVSATEVLVGDGAALAGEEWLFAARDRVVVGAGASVTASGGGLTEPEFVALAGDGAFLRVSAGEQVDVRRAAVTGAAGVLEVATGATLDGSGSLTLGATRDTLLQGTLRTSDGSISLESSRIALGAVPTGGSGLQLSGDALAALNASELRLISANTIDIYGSLDLELDRLTLSAAGLAGFDNAGGRVRLAADVLRIGSAGAAGFAAAPTGSGSLLVEAGDLLFDAGAFDVRGYGDVRLDAAREIVGRASQDETVVRVAGDLTLRATRITGLGGADLSFETSDAGGALIGNITVESAAQPVDLAPVADVGARLRLAGLSIDHAGTIELPSGVVELSASGPQGIVLQSGSRIDAGGRNLQFADAVVGTPGGAVSLVAPQGGIAIADGAAIDVSGADAGGEGGFLGLDTGGTVGIGAAVEIDGRAASGERQGRITLTANGVDGSLSALNLLLNDTGFTDSRRLRLRAGDVTVGSGETIRAREFVLVADGGGIDFAGTLDAAGPEGGRVSLLAQDDLELRSSARIDARATRAGENGGVVTLATVAGQLDLQAAAATGAGIDVSGAGAGGTRTDTGRVHLRAPRVGSDEVAVVAVDSDIVGAARVDLEALGVYEAAVVDAALLADVRAGTDAYMASAASIEARLGRATDPAFHFVPGVEIRAAGDLAVDTGIDLLGWRYAGEAGVLTLRAGGTLGVNVGIRDGVADVPSAITGITRETVQSGSSWSLRLLGGADLGSADILATSGAAGDVRLAAGARVRTGTGSIEVSSSRDIRLADATSALYTVGTNRGTGALPEGGLTPEVVQELLYEGDFVEGGGDLSLQAGRDIIGANGRQLFSEWLPRVAGTVELLDGPAQIPASWAIAPGRFNQNVGALGGGAVRIVAGRDLVGLSAVVPTNAQPAGAVGTEGATAVAGGGDLFVSAGRDIRGGSFLVGEGAGILRAGGTISPASGETAYAVLGLGRGSLDVRARRGLAVESVLNPTVVPVSPFQGLEEFQVPQPNYFFTFQPGDVTQLSTLAGDLRLGNRLAVLTDLSDEIPFAGTDSAGLTVYPGSVRATSLQGSIVLDGSFVSFPDTTGNLVMLAGRDVSVARGQTVNVIVSDADPALLPGVTAPAAGLTDASNRLTIPAFAGFHAAVPVHRGDATSVLVVARAGTLGVTEENTVFEINSSKQATLVAGGDIRNLRLRIQHANDTDVSVVEAGDDVLFPAQRTPSGTVVANTNSYDVSGPGQFYVLARGSIDLGSSSGVRSFGNLANPALATAGADLTLVAGLGTEPDYAGFVDEYLVQSDAYAKALDDFLASRGIQSTDDVAAFLALPLAVQRELIFEVLFAELRESGVAAANGSNDYTRGFDAIGVLFPGEDGYDGDIKSFLSQVSTLDGGEIRLLAPGGLINAGVAAASGITKSPSELGITAQREGDISAFADGDFLVNQSRVFALDGGDILIWSSTGDIDAGRGAKTALAIPPPKVTFDANGNAIVEFPAAVSGSGIRGAVSTPGREPGDVFLFAPAGVVDAGDAGIGSAGNITIGAIAVIGADNINVGGVAIGVPVDAGGLGASLAGVSSTTAAASGAAVSGSDDDDRGREQQAPLADAALSFLEVFVIGLGEDACRPEDIECLKRQGEGKGSDDSKERP